MEKKNLSASERFNALSTAKHIFAFKEEKTPFKLVEIIESTNSIKAIVELQDGSISCLYADSQTAKERIKEAIEIFGDNQPFLIVDIGVSSKGKSIYQLQAIDV